MAVVRIVMYHVVSIFHTVDGLEIPNNHLGFKKPFRLNNGINMYKPQLVQAFSHQQSYEFTMYLFFSSLN